MAVVVEIEEAAACLGAKPLQVFRYILVPALLPAWLTGFALAACLGLLVFVDFLRANTPWVVYWNYEEKYAVNPVLEFLHPKAFRFGHEGRGWERA